MEAESQRGTRKTRWFAITAAILGGGLTIFVVSRISVHFLVEWWWFDSVGQGFTFWQRLLYKYAVFGTVTCGFFLIFFLNFRFASRYLRRAQPPSEDGGKRPLRALRIGSRIFYIPLALFLAAVLALPAFRHWRQFLLFFFGPSAGVVDPVFGKDVSYYLFSFPIYRMIQSRLLLCLVALFLGLVLLYRTETRVLAGPSGRLPTAARWHLSLVLLAAFLVESWDFILQRNALVYKTSYAPLFFGPGFVDLKLIVPLIWLQVALWIATVLCLLLAVHYNKGFKVLAALVLAFLGALGAGHSDFLPKAVIKYIVKPNEFTLEAPFIAKNIKSTLQAYRLQTVEVRDFSPASLPAHYNDPKVEKVLRNIPLWEARTLKPVLEQLQELRSYYSFSTVSADRYTVAGEYEQTYTAPRELDYGNLPGVAGNWVNRHLTYTHGYGAVMTPANQTGGGQMTWFIHGIPIESDYGLSIGQPDIYFGLQPMPYAIAPNRTGEMDYPSGNSNRTTDYRGRGGVPLSSLFHRLVFAWHFEDRNLLLTDRLTDRSRILFRRNIIDRVRALAPFLTLDTNPYMVATPRGIFWILDAYTTSDMYPDAAPSEENGMRFNYIRNSVKIVVDAYNGTVNFYIFDSMDPIVRAYSRIYPELFKDKAEMPADLRAHIRYPRDLFDIQMRVYMKYHQIDPKVFYQEEDVWTYADEIHQGRTEPMKPYYLTLDLFEPDRLDFVLLAPMIPKGRDNLRALAAAGCDGANYGKLIVYELPKGKLVLSPTQIFAVINEEPRIAQQFTLWDQAGSKIDRGRVIILPIARSIFYIQPVYLKSSYRVQIPELQRIIVSEGQLAVMETSLDEAYKDLWQLARSELKIVRQRYPQLSATGGPLMRQRRSGPATGRR